MEQKESLKVLKPSDGTSAYSDWCERDVLEMEGKVKAKLDQYYKPSSKIIFSQTCTFQQKKSRAYFCI